MTDGKVVTLSRFRADVARALSRRGRELLAAADPAAAMQELAPLEAYFITKELGVDEAMPLLAHATSEQLQTFVDLDCWEGDQPSPEDLDAWLAPFAAEGPEALMRAFSGLDEELQVLFLGRTFTVYDARAEDIPEPLPSVTRLTPPDGVFVLDAAPGEREVEPAVLVDALYKASLEEAFRLLTAAKWDSGSDQEEQALRFRTARLEELGFPPPGEAVRLYSAPPAEPPPTHVAPPPPVTLPALYARTLSEESLLTRALQLVADAAQLERLERDLVYVVNTAVVASGNSPRDLANVQAVAERVRDTVSLGLDVLLARDGHDLDPASPEAAAGAATLLGRWHPFDLFRHGNAAAQVVARSARALAADPVVASWLERSDEGAEYTQAALDRAFLRALVGPRPLLAGWDVVKPDRARAFATRRELLEAEARIDGIEAKRT